MSGDVCRTKHIEVEVQENGIIRDSKGWILGRLDSESYPFGDIREEEKKLKWHEMPFVPGFILGGGMLITFVLGVVVGHMSALSGFGV